MTAKNKSHTDSELCETCIFAVGPNLTVPEKYSEVFFFFVNVLFARFRMCNNSHSAHYRHVLYTGHGCSMYEKKE